MTAVPDWHRVKETFQEALALPAHQRVFRVRQMCGDDLALLWQKWNHSWKCTRKPAASLR